MTGNFVARYLFFLVKFLLNARQSFLAWSLKYLSEVLSCPEDIAPFRIPCIHGAAENALLKKGFLMLPAWVAFLAFSVGRGGEEIYSCRGGRNRK